MFQKENIGVAIITKDSELSIELAIKSVQTVSRQIVVVDTGSTDKTPTIATRLGAEVFFRKWDNNFSNARNHAISFIRTEWILSIDSDETLDIDSFNKNRHLLSEEKTGGLQVKILNFLKPDDSSYQTEHTYTRVFRKNPKIKYEGSIHEQINNSIISCGLEIVESDIVINHYGYINTTLEKISRNKELLNDELVQNPNDEWYKFHLAETEFASGNINTAKELFESIVFSEQLTIEQKEKICIRLSQIALKNDIYDEVEKWLNFKSLNFNTEGFRKFILATSLMMRQRFSEAGILIDSNEVKNSSLVDRISLNQAVEVLNAVANLKNSV
ncbi:MAG: glycosyltransferase family 2 protein [Ignavibacteriae bacterium]|nr:glycosyltransferase family 2 protein [Ignavibacteriota bacterium]